MNADILLAHFDRIADVPDAVALLRRFVLDLAVRGKLVPQDEKDEPASELLATVVAEKAKLARSGEIPRSKVLPRIPDAEKTFELPHSWVWVRLGELCALITSGSRDWAQHYADDGAIFIRMGNLSKGHYHLRMDNVQHVNPPKYGEGTRTRLAGGDILISITGDVGMLGLVPDDFGEAYINQHTALVRPLSTMKGRYLAEFFRSTYAQQQFDAPRRGIKNSFRLTDVTELVVPLPPLAEQRRIVAKVDELMALCDQLEAARTVREETRERMAAASLARLNNPDPETFPTDARFAINTLPALTTRPDQVKQLRQTILNLAVRGELVPQDLSDEGAVTALRLIDCQVGRKAVLAVADENLPYEVHKSWRWITLGRLVLHSDAGWSPKTVDQPRSGDEWGVLKVSAVSWGSFLPNENKALLPGMQPRRQAAISKGDFLISRANTSELVAKAVIVDVEPYHLMMSDKIVRLKITEHCDQRYIYIVNNYADFARNYYARRATGVSPSMKNVSRDVILDLPIPLPPLAEQRRIVAKVNELMALCDQLEASLTAASTARARLLEATLHAALATADPLLSAAE